jgi:lipopolysaccharide export system protein LptC
LNAISNIPRLAKILLPLLAIVSLWLGFNHSSTPELSQENEVIKTSDYAMTDFTLTVMDLEGNPSRIITGSEMAHYPKDDSTEIINPVAQFLEQEKDTWIVSSNKATTVDKGQDIVLTGNVIATQADNPDIELRTELLNLDTVHNTAYTNLPVTMKSPHGETDSVGLHASLDQQTINLHSRVKGHYDAPPIQ